MERIAGKWLIDTPDVLVQILDMLFFDFIDLAEKLQPKVVIAENVTGILKGNARDYVRKIISAFDLAGYLVQDTSVANWRNNLS